jgi:hypothetical protein
MYSACSGHGREFLHYSVPALLHLHLAGQLLLPTIMVESFRHPHCMASTTPFLKLHLELQPTCMQGLLAPDHGA